MNTTNLITFGDYIIDAANQTYKAVWNCQVEWTDECIYYDAETGRFEAGEDDVEFICEHRHKVTKHEYEEHRRQAAELRAVTEDELKQRFNYRQVV
jgi:hypothetical protein